MKRIYTAVKSLIIIILLSPLSSKGAITLVPPFVDSIYCAGDTFSIGYNVTLTYNGSNVFSVLLSNASGSFVSPTIIGTKVDSIKGTILCTIPANITSGINYRIKIHSSSPIDSTAQNGYPIEIIRVPAPVASANPASICVGDSLRLSATDSVTVSYSWTGPAGFSSSSQNPIRFNAQVIHSGNYFVTASIASCSTSSFVTVSVKPLPPKPVASHLPVTPCLGDTLQLSSSTIAGATYSWTGPGFNSSLQNPTIANIDTTKKGSYIVTVTLSGCTTKDTTILASIKLEPVKPVALCDSPACGGSIFHLFANSSTTGVTFTWIGPPSFVDTLQNPVINNLSLANTGAFVVTVTKNGCSARDTVFVNVSPKPLLAALTVSNACEGDTLKLHTSSTSSGTYYWTSTNGYVNITQVGDITRLNADTTYDGNYRVVLKDAIGCMSDTGLATVSIKPKPAIPTIQSNSPVCEHHNLILTGNSSTTGVSYSWAGPGGISSSNNQMLFANAKPTMSGNYVLTAAINGCFSSANANIVVNQVISPDVTITADPGAIVNPDTRVMFTAHALNAGSNPTYQWKRNGIDIPGATGDIYLATIGKDLLNKDQLSVRVVSNEVCPFPDTVTSYIFTVTVNDLTDIDVANEISVCPSPNYGKFTIKGTVNTNDVVEVRIIDIVGQLVYESSTLPANKHLVLPIEVTGIASGIYILQLKAGEQFINKRFTVK